MLTVDTLLDLRRKELALAAELETLVEQLREARADVDLRKISKLNDDRRDLRRRLALVIRALPGVPTFDADLPLAEAPAEARELIDALDRIANLELQSKALVQQAERLKPAAEKILSELRAPSLRAAAPAQPGAPAHAPAVPVQAPATPAQAPSPAPTPEPTPPATEAAPPPPTAPAAAEAPAPPPDPNKTTKIAPPVDPPTEPTGKTIKLELPAEPVSTPATYPPLGMGRAVLVVDDDMVCRAVCRKFFGRFAFQVYETGSLAQAQKALDVRKVDLVLLDEHLPDGLGTSLLKKISAMPGVRVILMTGADEPSKMKAMQEQLLASVHIDGFWVKPLNPDRIARVATRLVALEEDPEAPRRPDGRALLDWQHS